MAEAASTTSRDIGIDVPAPTQTCTDKVCPFHGHLKVRGQILVGNVVSAKMERTVTVKREILHYNQKFERYERRSRKYAAHLPQCMAVKAGDQVRIMECRPISKTVAFVVVENKGGVAA